MDTDVSLLSLNSSVVDLVHEEVHKMRSSIEIKWAVAEHEIDRILGLMGLKSKGSMFRDLDLLCDNVLKRRPDMSRMTVRMRKTFDIARPNGMHSFMDGFWRRLRISIFI